MSLRQASKSRAHDPAVDQSHQAEPFCRGEKTRRRHDVAGLIEKTDQNFEMRAAVVMRAKRGDLLGIETEPVVFESLMDALHPAHLVGMADEILIFGTMDMDAIATFFLGHETRHVGGAHHLLRRHEALIGMDKADACRDPERALIPNEIHIMYGDKQGLCDGDGFRHAMTFEKNTEFVAAESCHQFAISKAGLQRYAYPLQQRVAGCVAAGVVDDLELVNIQKDQGMGLIAVGDENLCQAVFETAPIGNARERVVRRLPRQFRLDRLALFEKPLHAPDGQRGQA